MFTKLNGPTATLLVGICASCAGVSSTYLQNKNKKELQTQNFEEQRQLQIQNFEDQKKLQFQNHTQILEEINYEHNLELERMKSTYNNYYNNSFESNSNSTGLVTQMLNDLKDSNKLTDLSNNVDSISFNINSVLDSTVYPTDPQNLILISYFLFNLTILWCIIGLTLNYYIKLYGDQYLDHVPKWLLPLMKIYLKYTLFNSNILLMILLISVFTSMLLSIALYLIQFLN